MNNSLVLVETKLNLIKSLSEPKINQLTFSISSIIAIFLVAYGALLALFTYTNIIHLLIGFAVALIVILICTYYLNFVQKQRTEIIEWHRQAIIYLAKLSYTKKVSADILTFVNKHIDDQFNVTSKFDFEPWSVSMLLNFISVKTEHFSNNINSNEPKGLIEIITGTLFDIILGGTAQSILLTLSLIILFAVVITITGKFNSFLDYVNTINIIAIFAITATMALITYKSCMQNENNKKQINRIAGLSLIAIFLFIIGIILFNATTFKSAFNEGVDTTWLDILSQIGAFTVSLSILIYVEKLIESCYYIAKDLLQTKWGL